jgi:hypothetical protein
VGTYRRIHCRGFVGHFFQKAIAAVLYLRQRIPFIPIDFLTTFLFRQESLHRDLIRRIPRCTAPGRYFPYCYYFEDIPVVLFLKAEL